MIRLLGTPSASDWPSVTSLPHWRPNFPEWVAMNLNPVMPSIEQNGGVDLVEVP
jgi:hypothetical protein